MSECKLPAPTPWGSWGRWETGMRTTCEDCGRECRLTSRRGWRPHRWWRRAVSVLLEAGYWFGLVGAWLVVTLLTLGGGIWFMVDPQRPDDRGLAVFAIPIGLGLLYGGVSYAHQMLHGGSTFEHCPRCRAKRELQRAAAPKPICQP